MRVHKAIANWTAAWRRIGLVAIGLTLLGVAILTWRGSEPGGIEDAWQLAFGPPDLGPIDFANLERRWRFNDALACHKDRCPAVDVDLEVPIFAVPGTRLRELVAEAALADPDTWLVYSARWEEHDRYVARSRWIRFPDTIDVRVFGAGVDRSTVALYSRSQIGFSDFGVNKARLRRWLERIAVAVREVESR